MIGRELTYETTPYPPDISIILKKGGRSMYGEVTKGNKINKTRTAKTEGEEKFKYL